VQLWRIIEQIASAIGDSRESEHYAKTRLFIRQAAAEGRLRIRGKHEIEGTTQDRTIFSEVYTEIPSTYWKHSVINVLATGAAFEADRHTSPDTPYAWGPKGLYEPNCYTSLQLNLEDASQLIGDLGAVAQTIPEKCQKLLIDHYQFVQDKNGTWFLYALVHNEDPYNVSSAVFSFDLLIGENFKVGYGSAYIQRLMHGNTEKVRITYTTDEDIKDYITTSAIGINQRKCPPTKVWVKGGTDVAPQCASATDRGAGARCGGGRRAEPHARRSRSDSVRQRMGCGRLDGLDNLEERICCRVAADGGGDR
jgi:hypothetical protein